jgi:hypothetical protein
MCNLSWRPAIAAGAAAELIREICGRVQRAPQAANELGHFRHIRALRVLAVLEEAELHHLAIGTASDRWEDGRKAEASDSFRHHDGAAVERWGNEAEG